MIRAHATTDDHALHVDFDATPYFEHASAKALDALAACDFGGDAPADQVLHHLAATHDALADLLAYLGTRNRVSRDTIGFEVHVNQDDARTWLAHHPPTSASAADNTSPAFVVLAGNPLAGYALHGPFRTSDHATNYASAYFDEWTVAPLCNPNDANDAPDEDWSGYGGNA